MLNPKSWTRLWSQRAPRAARRVERGVVEGWVSQPPTVHLSATKGGMAPKAAPAGGRKQSVSSTPGGDSQRDKGKSSGKKSGKKDKERKMHFTVPEGVQPGELLKLMTPRGGEVEVEVPQDAKVGKSFAVTVPASSSAEDKPKREAARISVKVPAGATPGQVIKGKTPAGREFDVAVPAGVKPGKSFLVMVPLEDDGPGELNSSSEKA